MLLIKETTNWNSKTFNKQICYHVFLEFGLQGRYLSMLSNKNKENKYHDVEMIWNRMGHDFMNVMAFQK